MRAGLWQAPMLLLLYQTAPLDVRREGGQVRIGFGYGQGNYDEVIAPRSGVTCDGTPWYEPGKRAPVTRRTIGGSVEVWLGKAWRVATALGTDLPGCRRGLRGRNDEAALEERCRGRQGKGAERPPQHEPLVPEIEPAERNERQRRQQERGGDRHGDRGQHDRDRSQAHVRQHQEREPQADQRDADPQQGMRGEVHTALRPVADAEGIAPHHAGGDREQGRAQHLAGRLPGEARADGERHGKGEAGEGGLGGG